MQHSTKLLFKTAFLLLVLVTLTGCSSTTNITGSWINPEASTQYQSILVTVLTPNVVAREAVENSLVEELRKEGVNAKSSLETFPPNFMNQQPEKQDILDKVTSENMDGILTITLQDSEEETRYVPGSTAYVPVRGSFGRYYSVYYPTMYDPGYYTTSKLYFTENNLYDVGTENLVWSAQSKTYDPTNVETAARGIARAVVNQMKQDGLFN